MNRRLVAFVLLSVAVTVATTGSTFGQQQTPTRNIVNIAPDLYRVQNDNHYTVFLVTNEGIIMSDPINRDFATWLKAELQRRFSRPVRYVLYTHRDWDHASGGAVFADTAQFIGHANMLEGLKVPGGNWPLPQNAQTLDANKNGRLERGEATGNFQTQFALLDANGDSALSGAEIRRGPLSEVHPPTVTYSDRHTVTLGGKTVHLIYTGIAHSDDSTVLHFPAERVVFAADTIQVKRFPGGVLPTVGSWLDAIKTIEKLDFDIAATGHALAGKKSDIVELRQYLDELAAGVSAGIGAGKTLQQIQQSLTFDKYKAWERYETQPAIHIAQVYATIKGSVN